jgi:hypothetical protein
MSKQKVILWGAGGRGKRVAKQIEEKNQELEIVAWIDSNPKLHGTKICGYRVYAPEEIHKVMSQTNTQTIVITVQFMRAYEVTKQIKELGVSNCFYIPESHFLSRYEKTRKDFIVEVDLSKPMIGYFEYHVCDHCNLNCHGCGHVSNICEVWEPTLQSYESDLKEMKRLFSTVGAIKLLGGGATVKRTAS